MWRILVVTAVAVAPFAVAARAQSPQPPFRFQTVALSEWPAPGTETGVTFGPLVNTVPLLNEAGQVSFFANPLLGPGVVANQNDLALYAGAPGAVRLVARTEARAPDTAEGVLFAGFPSAPLINAAGNVAFMAYLKGPGVVVGASSNYNGIWAGVPGAIGLVAREGEQAPGTPEGVRYIVLQTALRDWNDMGHVAFSGQVTGTGVSSANDSGLWAGPPGGIQLVARDGSPAPGTSVNYGSFQFGMIDINNAGQTVFENGLAGSVNASNNRAIFSGPPGNVQLAARLGQQAGGAAGGRPLRNDEGPADQ